MSRTIRVSDGAQEDLELLLTEDAGVDISAGAVELAFGDEFTHSAWQAFDSPVQGDEDGSTGTRRLRWQARSDNLPVPLGSYLPWIRNAGGWGVVIVHADDYVEFV